MRINLNFKRNRLKQFSAAEKKETKKKNGEWVNFGDNHFMNIHQIELLFSFFSCSNDKVFSFFLWIFILFN